MTFGLKYHITIMWEIHETSKNISLCIITNLKQCEKPNYSNLHKKWGLKCSEIAFSHFFSVERRIEGFKFYKEQKQYFNRSWFVYSFL